MQSKRVNLFSNSIFATIQQSNTTQQRDTFQQSSSFQPSSSFQQRSNFKFEVSMLTRMFIFLNLSFLAKPSSDSRTTFARQSHDNRENVVRRSMVINVRNIIGRTSCECLANVARMSRECRETFAND